MPLDTDRERFFEQPIVPIVAFSMLMMAALQAMPLPWQHLLRYDRMAVANGQWWRIVTGNFVHLGWSHMALNFAGLALGTWLFGRDRGALQWVLATLVVAVASGLGLYLFSPEIGWCVGLSGVLHGLMIVGFGGWLLAGERWALALLALVIGKMAWENFGGNMPWAAAMAGGRVVTQAHLWGAVGGVLFLTAAAVWQRRRPQV